MFYSIVPYNFRISVLRNKSLYEPIIFQRSITTDKELVEYTFLLLRSESMALFYEPAKEQDILIIFPELMS